MKYTPLKFLSTPFSKLFFTDLRERGAGRRGVRRRDGPAGVCGAAGAAAGEQLVAAGAARRRGGGCGAHRLFRFVMFSIARGIVPVSLFLSRSLRGARGGGACRCYGLQASVVGASGAARAARPVAL